MYRIIHGAELLSERGNGSIRNTSTSRKDTTIAAIGFFAVTVENTM